MTQQRTKLWIGIGACVVAGSGAAAPETPVEGDPASPLSSVAALETDAIAANGGSGGDGGEASDGGEGGQGGEGGEGGGAFSAFAGGGEGGEGGEGGGNGTPSATDHPGVFYSRLALSLGQLSVAEQLLDAGATEAARAHMRQPARAQLPELTAALEQRGLADRIGPVERLAQRAEHDDTDESTLRDALDAARASVTGAMGDVEQARRGDARFLADVAITMLKRARAEYQAAITDGEFVDAEAYRNGYGYVQSVHRLLRNHADHFEQSNQGAYQQLQQQFEAARAAWPSATTPSAPAMSVSELYGRVSTLEFTADQF